MRSETVSADGLEGALRDMLSEFTDEKKDQAKEVITKHVTTGAKELAANSPKGATKKYAKGWKVEFDESYGGFEAVIGNDLKPGLTHLLEKGHLNRDGSRTPGVMHIAPVYEGIKGKVISDLT